MNREFGRGIIHLMNAPNHQLSAPPPAVCPYCGLDAIPNIWGDATKTAVYRDEQPFARMELHLCPLDHHWWVILCLEPKDSTIT